MSFVERHGLWSDEQKEAAQRLRRIAWMEVDVKRRRGAPWAAPVPREIAGKVHHLTAAE